MQIILQDNHTLQFQKYFECKTISINSSQLRPKGKLRGRSPVITFPRFVSLIQGLKSETDLMRFPLIRLCFHVW